MHLTNYIQEGTPITKFLQIMGDRVGRAALFGIPLQQLWSYRNTGDHAPTYYLQTDDPLYYYSFTDAVIAMAYRSLSPADQQRFDPMITGFDPADMYAADHIRRVLTTFPGVFSGIGEFTIHKEFVSSKVCGPVASLTDPALDRVLDFAGEVGLIALIHSDIDVPFPKPGTEPAYLGQMRELLSRHPETTIIWAHTGVGRVVRPIENHLAALESTLRDPAFTHVHFDLSWDEVAKYIIDSPAALAKTADLINRYPDRFLYGSDEVAPSEQSAYLKVFELYHPLWKALTPEASEKVRQGNHARLFDAARSKVRAWEKSRGK
ncbi:MAG: amidohydrolase family protein [Myxococcales bacterium]